MKLALLDTSIIEGIMQGSEPITQWARRHMSIHQSLMIPVITYYEVMRGLGDLANSKDEARRRHGKERIRVFGDFCSEHRIIHLQKDGSQKAAELWAYLRHQGISGADDCDILIAGMALARGYAVATKNVRHFQTFPDLDIEDLSFT